MLLVLACTVCLLFVAPGMILVLGRVIEANTDGRRRAAAAGRGREISMQSMGDVHGASDPEQAAWFRRPMLPAFTRPTLFE